MKKASCVLIIVLLLLLEISAKAEWVSIVELLSNVFNAKINKEKALQIHLRLDLNRYYAHSLDSISSSSRCPLSI